MFLNDFITIVSVNKGVVPHDQRREQLALYRCAQNCFWVIVSELLRAKISREFHCSCMLITVCSERSSYPCLCSGVDEKSVSRPIDS